MSDFDWYMATVFGSTPKEYTNLLLNGSFEADFANWNHPSSTPTICSNDSVEGGKCICWYQLTNKYSGVGQTATLPANHKAYVFYWYNITAISNGSIYAHVKDGSNVNLGYLQPPASVTDGWVRISSIFTSTNADLSIPPSSTNFTGTAYIDAVCVIDLTAKFGAGNEKTKAWCDTNITIDKIDWRLS